MDWIDDKYSCIRWGWGQGSEIISIDKVVVCGPSVFFWATLVVLKISCV